MKYFLGFIKKCPLSINLNTTAKKDEIYNPSFFIWPLIQLPIKLDYWILLKAMAYVGDLGASSLAARALLRIISDLSLLR